MRIKRGLPVLLVLFLPLYFCGAAFGDAAPDPLNSGISPSIRSHRVTMASEEVNIHLGEERVSIEAIFDLVNLAPDQVVLEVGFPTDFEDDVSNLKVTINGRPVEVREEKERLFYPESINVHEIKVNWALWEMTFPGRSETRLRVAYDVVPRKNHDFIITPYRDHIERIKNGQAKGFPASKQIDHLVSKMDSFTTGYILVTGAGWEGSIGEAVINVFHGPKGPRVIRRFAPEDDFAFFPDRLQWKFYYLDPDSDIEIEFNPVFTIEEEIALVEEALELDGKNPGLRDLNLFLRNIQKKMK